MIIALNVSHSISFSLTPLSSRANHVLQVSIERLLNIERERGIEKGSKATYSETKEEHNIYTYEKRCRFVAFCEDIAFSLAVAFKLWNEYEFEKARIGYSLSEMFKCKN